MDEMEEKYSIGEVSEIFQIPKSTLRYWESEDLIKLERNETNEYREYTLKQIVDLSDIAFYRSLNVSVKKLKKIYEMDIKNLNITLDETQNDVDNKISQLLSIREGILSRKDKIKQVVQLQMDPYTIGNPDIDLVVPFSMENFYLQNPYDFTLVITSETSPVLKYGSAVPKVTKEDEILWQNKSPQGTFMQCLLKVSADNQEQNNLNEHLAYLTNRGYKTGVTVARYLVTALDTIRYDYYKAWIEIL